MGVLSLFFYDFSNLPTLFKFRMECILNYVELIAISVIPPLTHPQTIEQKVRIGTGQV